MKEHQPTSFEIYWTRRRMWIAVTWSAMVVAVAVSYYFLVFLPSQEKARLEIQRADLEMRERIERAKLDQTQSINDAEVQAKADERSRLESCYQGASNDYQALWAQECFDRGQNQECRLPNAISDSLGAYYRDQRDICLKSYPQI